MPVVYMIENADGSPLAKPQQVVAGKGAQAVRLYAETLVRARPATPLEVLDFMQSGGRPIFPTSKEDQDPDPAPALETAGDAHCAATATPPDVVMATEGPRLEDNAQNLAGIV